MSYSRSELRVVIHRLISKHKYLKQFILFYLANPEWQELAHLIVKILLVYLMLATRWLYHLVSEVVEMSSALFMECWSKTYSYGSIYACQFYKVSQLYWNKFYDKYIKSFASQSKSLRTLQK